MAWIDSRSMHMHVAPEPVRYLRPRQLAERWACSATTIWRCQQRGILPKPARLSAGVIGWRLDVIEAIERARTPVHDDARDMRAGA